MTAQYEVGDTVECVNSGSNRDLVNGRVYKVTCMDKEYAWISFEGHKVGGFKRSRFRLFDNETPALVLMHLKRYRDGCCMLNHVTHGELSKLINKLEGKDVSEG